MKHTLAIQLIIATMMSMLFYQHAFSQSKKLIKNLKIKTVTETTTISKNGKSTIYKSSFTSYSKGAKLTNKTEYNTDGSILQKETATYDVNGNKIEESFYQLKETSKSNFKITAKYDLQGNKIEVVEYDGEGNFVGKQKFVYDNFDNKVQELTLDVSNKLMRKVIYVYDSEELKTKRQEFNEKNELVSERKYQYTFL